jgi:hypothetical protein
VFSKKIVKTANVPVNKKEYFIKKHQSNFAVGRDTTGAYIC